MTLRAIRKRRRRRKAVRRYAPWLIGWLLVSTTLYTLAGMPPWSMVAEAYRAGQDVGRAAAEALVQE